jgi:hypothetical protein
MRPAPRAWMRIASKAGSAFALCAFLAACTTWVKPGTDATALNMATSHCDAVAYTKLPTQLHSSTTLGANYGDRKKCEKNSSDGCVKRGDRYYAVIKTTSDTNSTGRDAIFRDCMYQDGWRPE